MLVRLPETGGTFFSHTFYQLFENIRSLFDEVKIVACFYIVLTLTVLIQNFELLSQKLLWVRLLLNWVQLVPFLTANCSNLLLFSWNDSTTLLRPFTTIKFPMGSHFCALSTFMYLFFKNLYRWNCIRLCPLIIVKPSVWIVHNA